MAVTGAHFSGQTAILHSSLKLLLSVSAVGMLLCLAGHLMAALGLLLFFPETIGNVSIRQTVKAVTSA
jgi:hypothetical protein